MRNLKILGLALVAVLALSAIAVSAASASTAVVTPSPVEIVGEDDPEGLTELTGLAGIKCEIATYQGTAEQSTVVLTPAFEECRTASGDFATVTANGCTYRLTINGALDSHTADVHFEINCHPGKLFEIHIYKSPSHTPHVATINIASQTISEDNIEIGTPTDGTLQITGSGSNISSTISGPALTAPPFNRPNHEPIPSPIGSTLHLDIGLAAESGLGLETD